MAGCAVIPILQGQEARLSGTVVDPKGAVLPQVTITAITHAADDLFHA